jgi:hypothetical protein
MKRVPLVVCFLLATILLYGQGAMVVSDPTSILQRLALATQEMEEQIEQKYKFIQQIEIAKKAYENSKKMQERVEQVSTYVKSAKEVVEIIALGEEIIEISKDMREQISNLEGVADSRKYQCIVDLINCTTNISEIAKRASAVVQDKGKENDVTLSDYERQQELRYLKNEMNLTKLELQRIYNETVNGGSADKFNSAIFSFLNF